MAFESLPNEIFLDIFDYFDGSDLFYTFFAINSRFNNLLYQEYREFRFDFRSISKLQFDQTCQQHLPIIADRVIALTFASLNDIPEQFPLFCSYFSSFHPFTYLQSLSLPCSEGYEARTALVDRHYYYNSSKTSEWYFKTFDDNHNHLQSIVEGIWSLSKLVHCNMGVLSLVHILPKEISLSIESLSWEEEAIKCNQLVQLVQHTPYLKHLSISLEDYESDHISTLFSTLISLKLRVFGLRGNCNVVLLLQKMRNLHSLEINLSSPNLDGHQLEDLITNYLTKLSKFRLKISMGGSFHSVALRKAISCADTFRSSFWTQTRRWFIRCFNWERFLYLCTVPNTFADATSSLPLLFYSTNPHDHLDNFAYNISTAVVVKDFSYPCIPFSNIEDLQVEYPNDDRSWSMVTIFSQLYSLTINARNAISDTQLQALFDRAPNLRRLTFRATESSSFEILLSLNNIQTSFRQLDFQHDRPFFTPDELIEFACSPFVRECEILFINVWNEEGILTLITCMNKLRVLEVACYDILCANHIKAEIPKKQASAIDKLIQWLQEHLPSTCLITNSRKSFKNIRIWL